MKTTSSLRHSPATPMTVLLPLLLAAALRFVPVAHAQTTYLWTNNAAGDASGSWAVAANWSPNTPAAGTDNTADFSGLPTGLDAIVTLDGNQTIGGLSFGSANNWILNPGTGGELTLAVSSNKPLIRVTNNSAVINIPLAGSSGVQFLGSDGRYSILTATNTYAGDTVQSGSAALGIGSDFALGTGKWFAGEAVGANQLFVIAAGAPRTVTNDLEIRTVRLVVRNVAAAGFSANALTLNGNVLLNNGPSNVRDIYNDQNLTINGTISGGPAGLIKNGGGTLTLTGNNTYTNGTLLTNGTLVISADANLGAAGTALTVANGTTLRIAGTNLNHLNSRPVNWSSFGNAGTSANTFLDISDAGNVFTVTNAISGTNWFNKTGAGTLASATGAGIGNLTSYATIRGGTLLITSGTFGVGQETMPGFGGSGTVIVSGSGTLDSYVLRVGDASTGIFRMETGGTILTDEATTGGGGGPGSALIFNGGRIGVSSRNPARNPANWIHSLTAAYVSTNGGIIDVGIYNMTVPQGFDPDPALSGSPDGGLTKAGLGTLTLSGTSSYVGTTVISNGTLAVNGTLASPISVLSGTTLAGTGTVSSNASLQAGGTVNAGGTNYGTLTVGALTTTGGGTLWFDLNSTATEGAGVNDELLATDISLAGTTTVYLNPAAGSLAASSRYIIARYTGTLTGGAGNLVIGGPLAGSRQSLTLDLATPGEIAILTGTGSAVSLTWVGDGVANVWTVGGVSNWLDTLPAPNNFFNGDTVLFDDSGSASPAVSLVGAVKPTALTVNAAASYTFGGAGKISGTTGLTKNNTGSLTLLTDNDHTGTTTLAGGTLQVGNGGGTGNLGTGNVNVTGAGATLVFNRTNALVVPNTIANGGANPTLVVSNGSITLGGAGDNAGAGALVNAGATLVLAKTSSASVHAIGTPGVTVSATGTLRLGGSGADQIVSTGSVTNDGTLDLGGTSESINGLNGAGLVTSTVNSNLTFTVGQGNGSGGFNGPIQDGSGVLALAKAGSGTQTLSGSSTYSGGTTLSAGVLAVGGDASLGAVPGSPATNVVFSAASTLRFLSNSAVNANRVIVAGSGAASLDVLSNTVTIAGPIRGAGSLTKVAGTGTLVLTASNSYAGGTSVANSTGGSSALRATHSQALGTGTITIGGGGNTDQSRLELAGGITIANAFASWASRSVNAPNLLNVSGTNTVNGNIAGGSGGAISTLQSDAGRLILLGTITTRQLNLFGEGAGELRGVVALQTGYNLFKNGGGTWTLAATNTYPGTTTVSNGTLLVTGVVPTNTVTIAGGTLAGTGMVRGATTVQAAGTLAPGNAGTGTLVISNSLTLQGTNLMEIARNGVVLANDQVVVSNSAVTLGGTVIVTNIGSSPLQVGDTFKLFSAASYAGAFTTVVLPAGPTWTNKLALDGTIAVLAVPVTVNTNATNLTFSYSSGNVQLGWPASHIGWELQVQTNARSTGLSTNWSVVPGSTTTNQATLPANPANGAVFYRLHLSY